MEENTTQESSKIEEQTEFKKPVLFGRIGKLPKRANRDPENVPEDKNAEKPENVSESSSKSSLPTTSLTKELSTPIPYKEPKWSGLCPDGSDYALEVLKSGMIVEKIDLTNKPYYVFGRLANCDVVMAHPTISRHHAVLQYKAFAEEGLPPAGWYVQDLGSTHGTSVNGRRARAGQYARVRVGHHIRFGASTRTYILLGPDFDCEGESELTVTEIKRRAVLMKLERDRMIQEAVEQRENDRLEEVKKREEHGIDWGMGEDAEEETDLADNPFAVTANEELYLEDPKKTLRGYFEREGHELSYDCEERGVGQFLCRVELPMDDARGKPVIAEVIHRGKKKEAVIACALEACRILDRAGLLRQAKHESRRRKQRDWSADDYYDSDEDTFLDRTGSVERKRRIRMEKHGAVEAKSDKPLTYDDLLKKITELENKISAEEKSLERLRSNSKRSPGSDAEGDALDAYMSSLQGQSMAQKAEISQAKMNIQKLKVELSKTNRLAELARPAHLPPLVKKEDKKMGVRVGTNSVVYGKRIRLKEDVERRPKIRQQTKQDEGEFVEEMDSDEETPESGEQQKSTQSNNEEAESSRRSIEDHGSECDGNQNNEHGRKGDNNTELHKNADKPNVNVGMSEGDRTTKDSESEINAKSRVFGPMRPPKDYVIPESYFDQISDRDLPEIMEKE